MFYRISTFFIACALSIFAHAAAPADPFQPPNFPLPKLGPAKISVRDFGAIGNGRANDTAAINQAIEKCTASGGGDVTFPAGVYAAASIHLKSNVRFVLDDKATIIGAKSGYDAPEPNAFDKYQDFGHSHFHNALMWGDNIENFGIVGGHVNGGALIEGEPNGRDIGDKVISITRGRNLQFENVTHDTGAHFVYLLNDCENVTLTNVMIRKSRDAVNLVSCRNVQIHHCKFTGCGDDTVALKSDYALGRKIDSENVYVWDCDLETAANALQFGSETIGNFRNINFWNIRISRALKAAIGITSAGGSVIEQVNYRDITIKNAACPIVIRVTDGAGIPTPTKAAGAIRNVAITNLTATDCKLGEDGRARTCLIAGRPDSPIENVTIENAKISCPASATGNAAVADSRELETNRALTKLPAASFYIRHAKDVKLKDIVLGFGRTDLRPAIAAFDVRGLELTQVNINGARAGQRLQLENVSRLDVRGFDGLRNRSDETVQSTSNE